MLTDKYDLPLTVKMLEENEGLIEGYGAVYDATDRDGDIIAGGAFAHSLKDRKPLMLWQHNAREPIGVWDMVRNDKHGLYLKGRLASEGRGKEARELVSMGALTGLSVGFITRESSRDPVTGVRTIHEADLFEVSLVTFPANEEARIRKIKNAEDINSLRDLEYALRNAGASKTAARSVCSNFVARKDLHQALDHDITAFSALDEALSAARRTLNLLG